MRKEIEKLSDAELRKRLRASGFPIVPVTETTRGILVSKLYKSLKKNANLSKEFSGEELTNISQMNRNRSYESEFQNCKSAVKDVRMRKGIMNNSSKYFTENNFPVSNKYLHFPSGSDQMDQYSKKSDYSVPVLPENNIATFTEQSHLGVVNRLLSFRDKKFRNHNTCENQLTSYISMPKEANKYFTKSKRKIYDMMSYIGSQSLLNQSFKPYMLVGTFIVFFIGLALIYMIQSPRILPLNSIDSKVNACGGLVDKIDCIPDIYLENAIDLTKDILKLLQIQAKRYHCNKKKVSIGELDIVNNAKEIYQYGPEKLEKVLFYTKMLIKKNPQWKIKIYEANDVNFTLLLENRSIFCSFYSKIQSFFMIIGIGALISLLSGVIFVCYRYVKAWRVNRSHVIEQFTADIINELIFKASLSEVPEEREVIINHLRDKLIPPNKRNSYVKYWKEALQLLEVNDSRIQFGIRISDGEEFRTMKWIGTSYPNARLNSSLKKWHSPAFDYTNKINNPPTSCLKIRHMFDPSESNISNLKEIIEGALIEKVGSRCCIEEIQIDKQSCCVYVRCRSEADAGTIHNEINGWWFDKRLISIKFLRLQRFLARFPDGKNTASIRNH
ncbi:inner nuclear membrane protein Man1 [Ceratitis capitata]|uniref:(Mediterranean fruit fly) hypothetical protein n=1 Tax=Ceratitis capitata TaxID=7213 RepID=W8CEJ9_CERCA|nr:inner nuclear membrane protein Man1 [Ceratitis capitata]CAD7011488.1 unnamed protein product [Ceratitis capitata]